MNPGPRTVGKPGLRQEGDYIKGKDGRPEFRRKQKPAIPMKKKRGGSIKKKSVKKKK